MVKKEHVDIEMFHLMIRQCNNADVLEHQILMRFMLLMIGCRICTCVSKAGIKERNLASKYIRTETPYI